VKDWVKLIYFKYKSTSWKTDLDDFVNKFDSRHNHRRIKLHDIKFRLRLCRDLCENYIAHCLFVWIFFGLEVMRVSLWEEIDKSTQGWKVSFWGSVRGKYSVNNKMNDLVGNILRNMFYACCYILLSGTRPKRRCTPICGAAMLLKVQLVRKPCCC